VNVIAEIDGIFLAINPDMPKTPLEESSTARLLAIHRLHIAVENNADKLRERLFTFLSHQEVIVIRHETISNHAGSVLVATSLQEAKAVGIVLRRKEDRRSSHSSVADVIALALNKGLPTRRHGLS
jgi:hypothetical protein